MRESSSFASRRRLALLALGALAGVGALGVAAPSWAHHSYAVFDASKTVTLEGTVVEFEWTNPHSWLRVIAPQAAGQPVEWNFETQGPSALARRGIRPKDLKAGDKISVAFNPRRDGANGGGLLSVTLGDGRVLMFR